ncbi:MAG TPA: hypothetical protein VGF25_07840 [Thermoleophilaceae bacterium]
MRRHARLLPLLAALAAGTIFALSADAATVVPVPASVVKVHTVSGTVVRDREITLGAGPVAIDVDGRTEAGEQLPDVDVSVAIVRESDARPLVPTVEVNRNATAEARGAPAPPLEISLTMDLLDAADNFQKFATVTYGYETPDDGAAPPRFKTRLLGPLAGGFIDPLDAVVETPGYSAPLTVKAAVDSATFDGTFEAGLAPLPERVHLVEDPRADGIDVAWDHERDIPDVAFDGRFDVTRADTGRRLQIDASVARLPRHLDLHTTATDQRTAFDYAYQSGTGKPDIDATYRDTEANGTIVADADVKASGLPERFGGELRYAPGPGGRPALDAVALDAPAGEVDTLDLLARNFAGDPDPVPGDGPDQRFTLATRTQVGGSTRFQATGRIERLRSARFERQAAGNDTIDVALKAGDGTSPFRVVGDVDGRGAGAPADARRVAFDATLTPLPQTANVNFDPASGDEPTRAVYIADRQVQADARAEIDDGAGDGCGQPEVTCLDTRIDRLPQLVALKLPGGSDRDFSVSRMGPPDAGPDVRATVDRTPADIAGRTYAELELDRVPTFVTGRLDVSDKAVLRAAEFHACRWDAAASGGAGACLGGTEGTLGRAVFAVRDRPSREGLPDLPGGDGNFVSVVGRDESFATQGDEHFEVAGRVDDVRHVAFHQRDANDDGQEDGTLGARVDAAAGAPLDIAVDDAGFAAEPGDPRAPLGETKADFTVHVDRLPRSFSACTRAFDATKAPPRTSDLPADALLGPCERDDVLGRRSGALAVTPLAVVYRASEPTSVTGRARFDAPDPGDRGADGRARRHTSVFDAAVKDVPTELRADAILPEAPEGGKAGRKLEARYDASSPVSRIDFSAEARRSDSVCGDPRPDQEALCLEDAVVTDLPDQLTATYDPGADRGRFELSASPPAGGAPRPSLNKDDAGEPFTLSSVSPDPGATPLVLRGRVTGITPRVTGGLLTADVDGEGGRDLAEVELNACRDESGTDRCNGQAPFFDGVEEAEFDVTNALSGDALPAPAPGPPGVDHSATFTSRDGQFRAQGRVPDLRELLYSRLDPKTGAVIPTTRLRAGFGDGSATQPVRVYVDTDDGGEATVADAVVREAPHGIGLCLRGPVDPALVRPVSDVWCERQHPGKFALQSQLTLPASGAKPDIDLRRVLVGDSDRTSVVTGAARIDNLGQRVDVLAAADQEADGPDVLVEGRDGNGDLAPVAGRVGVELQNFVNDPETQLGPPAGEAGFPWAAADGRYRDPEDDARNRDPGGGDDPGGVNVVKAFSDAQGRFYAKASLPAVKRLAVQPGPCYTDARVRPPGDFPADRRPTYLCLRASAAQNRVLGIAARSLDEDGQALALEQGHFDKLPGGEENLRATVAVPPDGSELDPLCGEGIAMPCRPPLLSLETDRADGQGPEDTRFEGRIAVGDLDLIRRLGDVTPLDDSSRQLDFEQPPGEWPAEARGARVKLGSDAGRGAFALRAGLNFELPRFLDVYPPTIWTCTHLQPDPGDCNASGVGPDRNRGLESTDLFLKLTGAESKHDGSDRDFLGRVAVLDQPFGQGSQVVLTGAPEPDGRNGFGREVRGASSVTPENQHLLGEGSVDPSVYGARLPGHFDVRVNLRNDYNAQREILPGLFGAKPQQRFAQVDGRVNRPLSLTLRLNDKTYRTRSGSTVPGAQVSALNLPGTNGADEYARPSFRLRSELRPNFAGTTIGGNLLKVVPELIGALRALESLNLFSFGPTLSAPVPDYVDIKLNADPGGDGETTTSDAAHTVEAVAGPFGLKNDAELRAFRQVVTSGEASPGGVFGKGLPAPFTSQAIARFRDLGAGAFGELSFFGLIGARAEVNHLLDAIVGLTGDSTERARLGDVLLSVGVEAGDSGRAIVDTDARAQLAAQVYFKALFGLIKKKLLDVRTGSYDQPLDFQRCPGLSPTLHDGFTTADFKRAAAAYGFPKGISLPKLAGDVMAAITKALTPLSCKLHDSFDAGSQLVDANHPAPRYSVPGHPIDGMAPAPAPEPAPQPTDDAPAPPRAEDVVVPAGETRVACGALAARTLVVSGTLRAGAQGESDPAGNRCDGSLGIGATDVIVEPGGTIDGAGRGGGDGGSIDVTATGDVVVDGAISASGADASGSGAGGGDGGNVHLVGLHVDGSGTVSADGGDDGGAGGRITIDSIAPERPKLSAAPGVGGAQGRPDLGDALERAAEVELHPDNPGPFQATGTVKLDVHAINAGGGPLDVTVCRRGATVAPGGLADPALDPPAGAASVGALTGAAGTSCSTEHFDGPTDGIDQYSRTIVQTVPHGYHGWFALAAAPGGEEQPRLPDSASATLGVDLEAPAIRNLPPFERNGSARAACPSGSHCLLERVGRLEIVEDDANMSGVATDRCRVNGGAWAACGGTGVRAIELGAGDGLKVVEAQVGDAVGNVSQPVVVGRWFVDTLAPRTPRIALAYPDAAVNGWHRLPPRITVSSSDAGQSSGFPRGGLTLVRDGRARPCGGAATGSPAAGGAALATCSAAAAPADGVHQLAALARDLTGNVSPLQTDCEDGEPADHRCSIKVDSVAPRSRVQLGPGGFLAFRVVDNAGGSGFEPRTAPSALRFQVDFGAWRTWDPGGAYRLRKGAHTVCFYAVDVAGNEERPRCSRRVVVGAAPPAAVAPPAPIGQAGRPGSAAAPATPDDGPGRPVRAREPSGPPPAGPAPRAPRPGALPPVTCVGPSAAGHGWREVTVPAAKVADLLADPIAQTLGCGARRPTGHRAQSPRAPL